MATKEGQTTSNYVNCGDTASASSATFTYYCPSRGVSCLYSCKCSDYKKRCDSCRLNTAKRSYYEPEDYTYYPKPYYPWYPYYPYEPYHLWYPYTITWDGSPTTTSDTTWDNPIPMTDTCYVTD